jgi:hypothetical protein
MGEVAGGKLHGLYISSHLVQKFISFLPANPDWRLYARSSVAVLRRGVVY